MADYEDEGFPPETQKSPAQFRFCEICNLKTSESDEQPTYDSVRSNLLVVANKFGCVFVGCPDGVKVFSSNAVLNAVKKEERQIGSPIAIISLRNRPNWLGLSSDNFTLCVCCRTDKGPQILFFDLRNILSKTKTTKTPFHSLYLSKDSTVYVSSLKWNPSQESANLLAICLSTGSFHLLSVEKSATELAIRPDGFGASAVCWSPKGKQLIIGKNDGTLHQLTQKLEVRRTVSVTNVIDRSVKTCDILWLSTFHVSTAYVASEDDTFTQPNLFLADMPSKNEQRDVIWKNYEDPCFGMNESRESQCFFTFIDQWQMFVILSSNSSETAVIGKNADSQIWEIWTLDDSLRAMLPISEFTEEDSAPIGADIITTAKDRIIIGDAKDCEPMPVLAILTSDGVLCLYHMINLMEGYPSVVKPEEAVDFAGERATVVTNVSGNSGTGDDAKPSSLKQRLSAKPSTSLSGTPKEGRKHDDGNMASSLKPPFTTSTPLFAKFPPFTEGASMIEQPVQHKAWTKPPLTRESSVKSTTLSAVKHRARDESADTVFGTNSSGSSAYLAANLLPVSKEPVLASQLKPRISYPSSIGSRVPGGGTPPALEIDSLTASESKRIISAFTMDSATNRGRTSPVYISKPDPSISLRKKTLVAQQAHLPISSHKKDRKFPDLKGSSSELKTALEDMTNFEAELNEFRSSAQNMDGIMKQLGDNREKNSIAKELDSLSSFSNEIHQTAQGLSDEIQDALTSLLALTADAEDFDRKRSRTSAGPYKALLYSRPLDRSERQKLDALRGLYQYVVCSVRDSNSALDAQWEKLHSKKHGAAVSKGKKHELQMGKWEEAHQGLANNMSILHAQEMKIMLLSQQLDWLRLAKTSRQPFSTPMKSSSAVESSADLQVLADTLLLQRTNDGSNSLVVPEVVKQSPKQKLSPKKQAQLGQMLAERRLTPVRVSGKTSSSVVRPFTRNASQAKSRDQPVSSESDSLSSPAESASESSSSSVTIASPLEEEPPVSGFFFKQQTSANGFVERVGDGQSVTNIPNVSSRSLGRFTPPTQHISSMIPQGSATLGYGAPKSATADTKRREVPILSTSTAEAASNLNYPPRVVNIQNFDQPVPEEIPLPEKFEPESKVPVGAARVIQDVFNFVKTEKQQQKPKEFGFMQVPNEQTLTGTKEKTPYVDAESKTSKDADVPSSYSRLTTVATPTNSSLDALLKTDVQPITPTTSSLKPIISTASLTTEIVSSMSSKGSGLFKSLFTAEPKKGVSKSASMPLVTASAFLSRSSPVQTFSNQKTHSVTSASPVTLATTSGSLPELFKLGSSMIPSQVNAPTPPPPEDSSASSSSTSGSFKEQPNTSPYEQSPSDSINPSVPATEDTVTSISIPATTAQSAIVLPTPIATIDACVSGEIKGGVTSLTSSAAYPSNLESPPAVASTSIAGGENGSSMPASSQEVTQSISPSGLSFSQFGDQKPKTSVFTSFAATSAPNSTESGVAGISISITNNTAATTTVGFGASLEDVKGADGKIPASETSHSVFGATQSVANIKPFGAVSVFSETSSESTKPVFGASAVFGNGTFTTSAMLGPTQPSVFGAGSSASTTNNTAATTSVGFGASLEDVKGVDGKIPASETSHSVFGATQSVANIKPFGAVSVFSETSSESTKPVFGASAVFGNGTFTTSAMLGPTQPSVFGAKQPESVFGSNLFQNAPSFGQAAANKPVFGSTGGDPDGSDSGGFQQTPFGSGFAAFQPKSESNVFGSFGNTSADTQTRGFGGFGFGGLGGKPSQEAAKKNPFQISGNPEAGDETSLFGTAGAKSFGQTSSVGQGFGSSGAEDKSNSSIFGNAGAKSFGQTSSVGQEFGSSGFSNFGGGGVGSRGFGGFNNPQPSAFGAAPAFGSSAAFASPPSFGSSTTRSFGSGFGAATQSTGVFGQTSSDENVGFASFAKNDAPGFGNVADSSGFGTSQQTGFGSLDAQNQKSPSFSGWR